MATPEDRLNTMLENRAYEAPRTGFADRIIAATMNMPQVQALSPFAFLKSIFAEFHLPQPAYALAIALVIGVFAGWQSPSPTATADSTTQTKQAYDYDGYDDYSEASL